LIGSEKLFVLGERLKVKG